MEAKFWDDGGLRDWDGAMRGRVKIVAKTSGNMTMKEDSEREREGEIERERKEEREREREREKERDPGWAVQES